jgi:hypothetical protein
VFVCGVKQARVLFESSVAPRSPARVSYLAIDSQVLDNENRIRAYSIG